MSRARLRNTLAAVVVAATALSAPAAAHAQTTAPGTRSLATVLAADGNHFDNNWSDFDIVDKAVHAVLKAKPHSAVGVLADGNKRVTAFLPTDRAFRRLVAELTGKRLPTERAVFRAITHKFDINTIEAVLLYHVVPGSTITYRQALKADGAKLDTALSGARIRVHVTAGHLVRLQDNDPDAANATVLLEARNINKGNKQIAHGVSEVLRPVNL